MSKLTLKQKAQKADGRSRMCDKCSFGNNGGVCQPIFIEICSLAFQKGYEMGYKQHQKEKKGE